MVSGSDPEHPPPLGSSFTQNIGLGFFKVENMKGNRLQCKMPNTQQVQQQRDQQNTEERYRHPVKDTLGDFLKDTACWYGHTWTLCHSVQK